MTLKILIVNTPDNPQDRVIEVARHGSYEGKTVLWAGMSMEGLVFDGSEYHVKEIAVPAPQAQTE